MVDIVWKDITFLTNTYHGYEISNDMDIRKKIINGGYHYFPTYKKGRYVYFDVSCIGGGKMAICINKLFVELFNDSLPGRKSRLELSIVRRIREEFKLGKMSMTDLSRKFTVSISTISSIVNNKTYKD